MTTASSEVDACIGAVNELVRDVDLAADNATADIETAFNTNEPEACAFFAEEDPAAAVGLSDEELLAELEIGLPPAVFDVLSRPSPEPFEHTVDEL